MVQIIRRGESGQVTYIYFFNNLNMFFFVVFFKIPSQTVLFFLTSL